MKPFQIAILGSMLLLGTAAFAQTNEARPLRNEINIGYIDPLPVSFNTRIGFKHHTDRGAYRVVLGRQSGMELNFDDPTSTSTEITTDHVFRVGYQLHQPLTKNKMVVLYYGADITVFGSSMYAVRNTVWPSDGGVLDVHQTSIAQTRNEAGIGAFAGLRAHVNENVSLSAEFGGSGLYNSLQTGSTAIHNTLSRDDRSESSGFALGGLQMGVITLNIHL